MDIRFIYITCPNPGEAERIGRSLVENRLAACVNIIGDMRSIYRWQGKICEEDETVLIAKTTADHVPALIDAVKALHPYDCPCIAVLPIDAGYGPYLDWIRAETDT